MDIKKESLKYLLRFRRELEDHELKFLPAENDSLKLSSPVTQTPSELIQLSDKRIPTLSSALGDTREVVKCFLIKD